MSSVASSSAMSASSSGTGGGPCVPVAEDCGNGLDDDCDGKPDCLDTDCICVDGTKLVNAEAIATPDDGKGNCTGAFAAFGYAECNQCQCNGIAHGSCEVHVYLQSNNCNLAGATDVGAHADCEVVNNGHFHSLGQIDMVAMPTCTPKALLTAETGLCTAPVPTMKSNCAMNQICAPTETKKPPCLAFDGDVMCPAGFNKKSAYATAAPGQCSCNCSPSGETCPTNMTYKLSPNMNCSGASAPIPADGTTCDNYNAVPVAVQFPPAVDAMGGTCALDAQPNGASAAKTICCPP